MRQIESIRKHHSRFDAVLDEVKADFEALADENEAPDVDLEALRGNESLESAGAAFGVLEAIILDKLRPPYLILQDKIEIRGDYDRVDLIRDRKDELEKVAKSVGRVDLFNHRSLSYAGTGWLIEKDVAVTNRHVAQVFSRPDWAGGFKFDRGTFGELMEARLDYVRQKDDGGIRRRADVLSILYVAGPGEPDIALLKVEPRDEVEPLELLTSRAEPEQPVAAVGYPASDSGRNDPELMERLYGGVYDVKRFAPGMVTGHEDEGVILLSDYTSLGGNSGSPVIDLTTGKVLGLHFAGAFRDANYAVAADIVAAARARTRTLVTVAADLLTEAPTSAADNFAGREGYDPIFLGDGDLEVPWPGLGPWSDDLAPVSDDDDDILKYRHFAVLQSKSRRLPLVTAVNIDGDKTIRLKRKGSWRLDGRIALEHQIGNELYRKNPLDRGHMVRRMDPGWGDSRDEAQQGESDTFHYTNSAPQHANLNQRDWVGLENYILESASTKDFKLTVFTGPVFRDTDRHLKAEVGSPEVPIPEEFWKLAVMVNTQTEKLSATGYVLSHGPMIRDLVEAPFVLGEYKTYQVQIAKVEQETGLDFGVLRDYDPLGADLDAEAPFSQVAVTVEGPADLRL